MQIPRLCATWKKTLWRKTFLLSEPERVQMCFRNRIKKKKTQNDKCAALQWGCMLGERHANMLHVMFKMFPVQRVIMDRFATQNNRKPSRGRKQKSLSHMWLSDRYLGGIQCHYWLLGKACVWPTDCCFFVGLGYSASFVSLSSCPVSLLLTWVD